MHWICSFDVGTFSLSIELFFFRIGMDRKYATATHTFYLGDTKNTCVVISFSISVVGAWMKCDRPSIQYLVHPLEAMSLFVEIFSTLMLDWTVVVCSSNVPMVRRILTIIGILGWIWKYANYMPKIKNKSGRLYHQSRWYYIENKIYVKCMCYSN